MLWIIAIAVIGISTIGPLIWAVFVHPIRSATTILKLALGVGGILYLLSGILLESFQSGAIGVILLICASVISARQGRRI